MAKPFDAALKHLLEVFARDWATFFASSPVQEVEWVDADVSTVSAQADKVMLLRGPKAWLLHLELQASRDRELPRRVLLYNLLLHHRHRLPVQSVVVLLRRQADSRELTGILRRELPGGRPHYEFHYDVVRLWRQSVTPLLTGGTGLLPLAPLANVPPAELPVVLHQMRERFEREVPPDVAADLLATT